MTNYNIRIKTEGSLAAPVTSYKSQQLKADHKIGRCRPYTTISYSKSNINHVVIRFKTVSVWKRVLNSQSHGIFELLTGIAPDLDSVIKKPHMY